jgi:hypothetical protein
LVARSAVESAVLLGALSEFQLVEMKVVHWAVCLVEPWVGQMASQSVVSWADQWANKWVALMAGSSVDNWEQKSGMTSVGALAAK